ncbi:serologically defined colon cancer antigen 8 homolog isoform X2 [Thalassophryne amazonica]|uniref:serologically defined colon cancer antigen 8 homolog isoform X2 n=1 Tax=Thalassophryne amazonica TaxID=390379 RepID=UPI0014725EE4|nr:serologically defined colon cancer antigen 8 homolog isoform X2 [Thalassophryne amazonica]
MKPVDSDEEEEQQQQCANKKELRQRANESIQQLHTLENMYSDGAKVEDARGSDSILITTVAEDDNANTWRQKTQSDAVNQLKNLLMKQCREISTPLSPSKKHSPSKRGEQEGKPSLSAVQDLVPAVSNQPDYVQHLQAEVKFCKEELQMMKQRIRVVVVENENLQMQLKCKDLDDSHKDYTIQNATEQLKVIHQSQIESLEAQVASLRKELSFCQKEYEEVKAHLRHKEKQAEEWLKADGAPRVAGLCLKCSQHEAVLAETHTNMHIQAIDRLTKERDSLLVTLRVAQTSLQEAQQREWSACLQVKQAVEMAEEANLHKSEMEVQCAQMSRELSQQTKRIEEEAQALKVRLHLAREEGHNEARSQKEELVSSLSKRIADLEAHFSRANREKSSLSDQLGEAMRKLAIQEQDRNKMCEDLRYQLSRTQLKKVETERELRELNDKTNRQMEKAAQEVEKLSSELVGYRQQLEVVQKDASQWQAKVLSLEEQLANAQRQLHLTRKEKESVERAHKEEIASVTLSAQERESALSVLLEQIEVQHQQRVGELDGLLSSQNSLIRKLKEECCMLGAKLEELTENSRRKLGELALERQHLKETVKTLRARCSDMEEQCVRHGQIHQRMKNRLQQLDRHCQSSAQQVCELLAKQKQLMHERNALTEETHKLRTQLLNKR